MNDANYRYSVNVASHGPQYVNPGYCEHHSDGIPGYWRYESYVEVDVYHNGNYFKTGGLTAGYAETTHDDGKFCVAGTPASGPSCPLLKSAQPINLVTGAKYKTETDLMASADGDLSFTRYYFGDEVARQGGMFGSRWRSSYDRQLMVLEQNIPDEAIAYRHDGATLYFRDNGAGLAADSDIPFKLDKLFSGATHIGWKLTDGQDREEIYDTSGRLTRLQTADGQYRDLVYDAYSRLSTVTSRDGRQLVFAYDSAGRLQTMTDASGAVTTYVYDPSSDLLGTVTYPGGASRQYFYNESGRVVSPPPGTFYLTGLQDENGDRHANYTYDSNNRAISSALALNAERVDVTYGGASSVSMTDALGRTTTRNWQVSQRMAKVTSASGLTVSSASRTAAMTYDASGYPNIGTDFTGTQTDQDYNARGLETQRIEAANDTTGNKRTVQTDWHATFRSPIERRVLDAAGAQKAKSAWTHNTRNQVLTTTATDPSITPNATRTSTYAYCEQADLTAGTCPFVGLLKSVDGPLAGTVDVTSYTYRQADDTACAAAPTTCAYRKGDLWKVTNALGHFVEMQAYDGAGRPLKILDANSIVTDLEYHPRGWLTARKLRGTDNAVATDDQITRIEYWPTGLIKKVTQPDGAFTSYTYDAAHRLTGMSDNAGNTITYTLNAAGERTKEDTKDVGGALMRTLSRIYNALGQLQTATDAYNRNTGFTYTADGNLDQTTDALTRAADNNYDPLQRLSRTLQDMAGIAAETKFTYDALDNLTQVNDPKGLNTNYVYNGFSELKQQSSPDTGTTTYTYDSAGNRASQVDARSKTTNYAYDALNRLTGITYPAATALNTTYTYDTTQTDCLAGETFSKGRLTKFVDQSGNTVYCYDRFGQLVRKVQRTNSLVFTLRYVYETNGRLQKIIYPNGAEADYLYDALGRIVEVGAKASGGTRQVLLTDATYYPFGPAQQWTYGNGRVMQRSLNQNYQPGFVQVNASGGIDIGYEFDEVGNLKKLRAANQTDPPRRLFGYDALNRLLDAKDGSTNALLQAYAYDKTGNRTSATVGAATTAYTYPTTNHRLTQVGTNARTYDNAGNATQIAGTVQKNFVYGDHNRMTQYKEGTTAKMNYVYNGKGEQVRKYISTTNTYSLYDEAGRWLADYTNASTPVQQVIWMGDLPVGVLVGSGASQKLHYIEPDALGTPRVVVDPTRGASGTAVWNWDLAGEAFGTTAPNQNPDGGANNFVFNMRFPGQRFDAASGLSYNYFRDYDAATGRYAQSDPIGFDGGLSTFSYAESSPLISIDRLGLSPERVINSTPESCDVCTTARQGGQETMRAVAQMVLKRIYVMSRNKNIEVCGLICMDVISGRFFSAAPTLGNAATCSPSTNRCPSCSKTTGWWHTHGAPEGNKWDAELMSMGPKNTDQSFTRAGAEYWGNPDFTGFLGTPMGVLRSYSASGGGVISWGRM